MYWSYNIDDCDAWLLFCVAWFRGRPVRCTLTASDAAVAVCQ